MKKRDKIKKHNLKKEALQNINQQYDYSSITCTECSSHYSRDANPEEIHKFLKLNKNADFDKRYILTCHECSKTFYHEYEYDDPNDDYDDLEQEGGLAKSDIYDS
jgi:hypothetical protein